MFQICFEDGQDFRGGVYSRFRRSVAQDALVK